MGAHPYWYFVPYDADVQRALNALREREFAAGRYNPVVTFPFGERDLGCFAPAHPSIAAAVEDAARSGDGTRSILDIDRVSSAREMGAADVCHGTFPCLEPERPDGCVVDPTGDAACLTEPTPVVDGGAH